MTLRLVGMSFKQWWLRVSTSLLMSPQVVLLFIALSAVGWIVFVAGFGEFVKG